jgi:3D (Asp-Asp-Asp) domain-containing protein
MGLKNKMILLLITLMMPMTTTVGAATTQRAKKVVPISVGKKSSAKRIKLTATAYAPKKGMTITTTGSKPIINRTVAVSVDRKHLLGKRITIQGVGDRLVTDLMHPKWKNRVDVYMVSEREARKFGVKKHLNVFLL